MTPDKFLKSYKSGSLNIKNNSYYISKKCSRGRSEKSNQRNLRASLSDSSRVRTSPSLTGPLTFLIMKRFWSSINLTLTWVTWPRDPVLPMTFTTIACLICDSILYKRKFCATSISAYSSKEIILLRHYSFRWSWLVPNNLLNNETR